MAVKIFPSVLGFSTAQYRRRLLIAKQLHQPIHLDVMDGKFVRTVSPGPVFISALRPGEHELHLMVRQPERWYGAIHRLKTSTVIVPVELGPRLRQLLPTIAALGAEPVLSINPATSVHLLRPWARQVRRFHVMTVNPGGYGAPFQRPMIGRIRQLHHRYPRHVISCDGGMNEQTIPLAVQAGAEVIIVGSAIINNKQPVDAWEQLKKIAKAAK